MNTQLHSLPAMQVLYKRERENRIKLALHVINSMSSADWITANKLDPESMASHKQDMAKLT